MNNNKNKINIYNYTLFLIFFCCYFSYRFTQIVVDAQIKTPGGKTYDVIFVGTGKHNIHSFFLHIYSIYITLKIANIKKGEKKSEFYMAKEKKV